MDCIYCNDSGMTCAPITGPTTAPLTWVICGCAAGAKIASRLALKARPGLDVPQPQPPPCPQIIGPGPAPCLLGWRHFGACTMSPQIAASMVAGEGGDSERDHAVAPVVPAGSVLVEERTRRWAGDRLAGSARTIVNRRARGDLIPSAYIERLAGDLAIWDDVDASIDMPDDPDESKAPVLTDDEKAHIEAMFVSPKVRQEGEKTPADRLADAVEECVAHGGGGALREALNDYHSTRVAHPSFNAIVGNPPDPVMLARLTVDALTGGALSSLICQIHDNVVGGDRSTRPASTWAWKENLLSNLRALGEKLP